VPLGALAVVPFFAYAIAFLLLPAGDVLRGAFRSQGHSFTFATVHKLFQGQYLNAYETSIKLSLLTAFLGGIFGLLFAYAALREGTPRWIRGALTTFSGVAANFGGVPLAFAWIATLGTVGFVTRFLKSALGIDVYAHGFSLFSFTGLSVVYLYFQIPLMVLVIAPAIDGLRREWREAAQNLGATAGQYWRHVGFPVLMPSILGAMILLFGNAFSAYATAYALTSGRVNVVPLLIGQVTTGNVLDDPHLGQALAFGMIVVMVVAILLYLPLQRRTSRWVR
jgi:putative spermidine/putrescine transport system permease protein